MRTILLTCLAAALAVPASAQAKQANQDPWFFWTGCAGAYDFHAQLLGQDASARQAFEPRRLDMHRRARAVMGARSETALDQEIRIAKLGFSNGYLQSGRNRAQLDARMAECSARATREPG